MKPDKQTGTEARRGPNGMHISGREFSSAGVDLLHASRVALPFCNIHLRAQKPLSPAYPRELQTLGDHLRKKRLDLGLLQRDVAKVIGATACSIMYWETNRVSPSIEFIPKIIDFLGYTTYDGISEMTLGEKIITCRKIRGLTQEELARRLGVDPTTLARWERNESKPINLYLKALNTFLDPIIYQN